MSLSFSHSEFETRSDRAKNVMSQQGIEVLLVTDPANMSYLTGYDGWSFYVHQGLVLSLDREQPIWWGRGMDANAARVTTYLDDANIRPYADDYVQSTTQHPMRFVAGLIEELGWQRKSIGVEKDCYYFTAACLESLRDELRQARFVDATSLVNWVRIVKSPAELEYMRRAARILERSMAAGFDAIRPGVRQCDAAAAIYHAQISGTDEFGGDYPAIAPLLPTGPGTNTPHLTWTEAPFKRGEATILELAGCHRRYHCPMARTLHLGPPPRHLDEAAKVVVEGIAAALEAARPGNRAEDVESAWRKVIAAHGIVKDSRLGYSTGLNYPPDWGEHTVSLRPGDTTVLRENMTLHLMPGIWQDDWGIEISECIRVGPNGGEPMAEVPRRLIVIE